MSVTTRPGAIALILTPRGAASMAAERTSEITAALEAEYSEKPGLGLRTPLTEALTTILPRPCANITGS